MMDTKSFFKDARISPSCSSTLSRSGSCGNNQVIRFPQTGYRPFSTAPFTTGKVALGCHTAALTVFHCSSRKIEDSQSLQEITSPIWMNFAMKRRVQRNRQTQSVRPRQSTSFAWIWNALFGHLMRSYLSLEILRKVKLLWLSLQTILSQSDALRW